MRYVLAVALLLSFPAHAQTTWERLHPETGVELTQGMTMERDPARCLALAAKMDAGEAGKRKPPAKEKTGYDDCIVHYNCSKVDASKAPPGAYATNVSRMRYLIQLCGSPK